MKLQDILTLAIQDFEANGFDSAERLEYWEAQLRLAIKQSIVSETKVQQELERHLQQIYQRATKVGSTVYPSKFTIANISPNLHDALSRRVMASAQLIKLNRAQAIDKTLSRFSGWATSVPKGGTNITDVRKLKQEVVKPISTYPYEVRRVLIDQGHKLTANISKTIAEGNGAIGARWLSHWKQLNYQYREKHKERDGKIWLVKDSWALQQGLIKVSGCEGYTDDIDEPSVLPFCRCRWTYLFHIRQLPEACLTVKGKEALQKARAA